MSREHLIYLVDEDPESRRSLAFRLGLFGINPWPFAKDSNLLAKIDYLQPGCIVLVIGENARRHIVLLEALNRRGIDWPVIILSRCEELSVAIEAMKLGSFDYLSAESDDKLICSAISLAGLALDRNLPAAETRRRAEQRFDQLTSREKDVALALVGGKPNKLIAYELGISIRTVEAHRAHVMAKLGIRSIAEILLLALHLGIAPGKTRAIGALASAPRMGWPQARPQWSSSAGAMESIGCRDTA